MKKKIMVLTGSPRAKGNSEALANAFIKGAEQAGHEIVKYDIRNKNIKGCTACDTCFSQGKACTFDNDFSEFAELVEDVDALIITTPLYWFSFPAQLKAVLDKFYAFLIADKKLNIKETMLLACAEMDNEDVFNGMIETYNKIAEYHKWENRGTLLVTEVYHKEDIQKTSMLEKAKTLGFEF